MERWHIIVIAIAVVAIVKALVSALTKAAQNLEATEKAAAAQAELDRVGELCMQLTGDPVHDRPLMNSVLALGSRQVPRLLEVLAEAVRHEVPPNHLARLEDLLVEFGLLVVGPTCDTLARLRPTSPLAASLLRVLNRLGRPGLAAVVTQCLNTPDLAPFLARLRNDLEPLSGVGAAAASVLASQTTHREAHADHLTWVVGLAAASARLSGGRTSLLDDLWAAWGSDGRAALLDWLCDWLPLARPEHLAAGLADPSDGVRAAAARLATLLVEPALVPALAELATTGDAEGRRAAVHALAAWPHPEAAKALIEAAADPDPEVAAAAVAGLALGPAAHLEVAAQRAHALPEGVRRALALEAPFDSGGGSVANLTAMLAGGTCRPLIIGLLGRHADTDPRALERLIQVASGGEEGAADALRVLAVHGSSEVPALLARALEQPLLRAERLRLQEVNQLLGGAGAAAIARRLGQGPRLATQLAVLRAHDFADAVPALLRLLEECRHGPTEADLAATIALGGHTVQEALDEALRLPGQGLLAPALHFLQGYATSADLLRLIELFDRHPPLRGILLALLELLGPAALPVLEARLAKGGDDAVVTALERRIEVLRATTGRGLGRPPA